MLGRVKNIFYELINSTYFKNIFLLTSGVGISQFIPFLLLPLLTRFFSPTDFGVLAVFMATVQLLAISSTFRLEMAVVLPKNHDDAAILCFRAFYTLVTFSVFFFVLFFTLWKFIKPMDIMGVNVIYQNYLPHFIYLVPIGALLLGTYNILYSWNNRLELYKNMSLSHITHSFFSTPLAIALSFSPFKLFGLILGQLIGRFFACVLLFSDLCKTLQLVYNEKSLFERSRLLAEKYRKFIVFETPHSILNFFSQKMIIAVFTLFFGFFTVGIFDLADKIIGKPLGIISNSFKTVFYKRLTTAKDKITIFKKSVLLMTLISISLTLPFYFIPPSVFDFLLGSEWVETGKYIQLICPLLFSKFIFNVVTPTISYTLQNHYLLIWQVIYLVFLIILFYLLQGSGVDVVLIVYALFGSFMYVLLGFISFFVLKKFNRK